jgi:hypothetical protein
MSVLGLDDFSGDDTDFQATHRRRSSSIYRKAPGTSYRPNSDKDDEGDQNLRMTIMFSGTVRGTRDADLQKQSIKLSLHDQTPESQNKKAELESDGEIDEGYKERMHPRTAISVRQGIIGRPAVPDALKPAATWWINKGKEQALPPPPPVVTTSSASSGSGITLHTLIASQFASGYFSLSAQQMSELSVSLDSQAVISDVHTILPKFGNSDDTVHLCHTLMVVVYIKQQYAQDKELWELVVGKAERWVAKQVDDDEITKILWKMVMKAWKVKS